MHAAAPRRPRLAAPLLASIAAVVLCTAAGADDEPASPPSDPSPVSDPLPRSIDQLVVPDSEVQVPVPLKPVPAPPVEEIPAPQFGAPMWSAPALRPRDFDWLRLTNGEWLKGEIKVLRSDELEFDSDEFDELTVDWDKIDSLRTAGVYTFGFSGRRQATGRALITADTVVIRTETGEDLTFDRADLYSIVHADTGILGLWQGKISLGATVRSGNTDQIDINMAAAIKRQTAFTRFAYDGRSDYGNVEGTVTVRSIRNNFKFDIFLTDRFFVTPAELEIFHDQLQNIKRRISPGAGLGYELIDRSWLSFNLQIGGVYRVTESISTEPGEDDVTRIGAATAGTDWEWEIIDRVDLDGGYDVSLGIPDIASTNHHASVVLSVEITKVVELDVSFIWDHVGQPVATDSSQVPKKNDLQLIAGLGINF